LLPVIECVALVPALSTLTANPMPLESEPLLMSRLKPPFEPLTPPDTEIVSVYVVEGV
jgi:hypothetical protein